MDVELRQLKTLVAIVDTGSFTDAAIDLGVSQAAVSRTLASLEQALKTRLLHRTSRTIALTPTGAQLVPRARRLLAEMDDLGAVRPTLRAAAWPKVPAISPSSAPRPTRSTSPSPRSGSNAGSL
jgi:DNA-binding transcriptional LysR family regulator